MFKNLNPDQLQALAAEKLQWHLSRLYGLWDELEKVWLNVNHETMQEFLHFSCGTPVLEIHKWFEGVNIRFCIDDVKSGVRLKPITSRPDRIPVYDRNGLQVCLGDKLKAQMCTGRYGRVSQVETVSNEEHTVYGAVNAFDKGRACTLYFNGHLVSGFDIGYKDFNDFEHGHETWAEIFSAK
jgi:hypothetical protein